MTDERITQLAKVLLGHSLELQPGDIFQIIASPLAKPLVEALYIRSRELGLFPVVIWLDDTIRRLEYELLEPDDADAANFLARRSQWEMARVADIKASLTIRAMDNDQDLRDIDTSRLQMVSRASEAVSTTIINQRQWVLFYWPTAAQAQKAGLSTAAYEDFVFKVSLVDYPQLYAAEQALARRMEQADQVRIVAPGTDITFSIKGMPAVCCYGRRNVPDGEVYTAPVRDSVNGTITYNVPTTFWGKSFRQVSLTFAAGRIIAARCDGDEAALNQIFDTDEGARYIGEFSFGVNPMIREPIGSTLFDEKIAGSIHLTPGNAYARADNGNTSAIHWDLIQIQRPEHGGGEIWLDGELIRKDGLFVPASLQGLNA
jgi:aminopeptidase